MLISHRKKQFYLRDMHLNDVSQVIEVEASAHAFPWKLSHFESSIQSSHKALVLLLEKNIVGYVITSTVMDEAELLNITISPQFQRLGLASLLINKTIASFNEKIHMLFLEVRASNLAAIGFYQSLDFHEIGQRPNYYPSHQGRETAIIMAKTLHFK